MTLDRKFQAYSAAEDERRRALGLEDQLKGLRAQLDQVTATHKDELHQLEQQLKHQRDASKKAADEAERNRKAQVRAGACAWQGRLRVWDGGRLQPLRCPQLVGIEERHNGHPW